MKSKLDNLRPLWWKLYDLFAATPLIAFYTFGVSQMLPPLALQIELVKVFIQTDPSVLPPTLVIDVLSKICTVVFFALLIMMFTLRRIPLSNRMAFYPRFVAGAGTFLGCGFMILEPQELSEGLYYVSLILVIGGTLFAIWSTLMLARSISIMPEARGLVVSGPYAFVRHPLYLGEFVVLFGFALQHSMPWSVLLLGVQSLFQLKRMTNEEKVLSEAFPDYVNYMQRTSRLLPGVY